MAAPSTSPALLYRQTALGDALVESLDALITAGKIAPDLALKVLAEFDSAFLAALSTKVAGRASFKGGLDTYRFCDSVWTFLLRDAVVKLPAGPGGRPPAREEIVNKIKIVAVDSRLAATTTAAGAK